ncbi:ferredoxin--NADP reductase [Thioclava sp. BHET1]|nr:ferredoxin--NADP reductase [Thioclava sp. BHET1]
MNDMSFDAVTHDRVATSAHPDAAEVTSITHWTDRLFSFRLKRPRSLRFRSGEFVMIGLVGDNGKPILRAYSIASPSWDEELEFYSIKVQEGPLTSRLQHIRTGDHVILRPKPVGTLVHDALLPGKRLYMVATGTGIAPFASLLRDPETWEKYNEVILTHTCRQRADLAYGQDLVTDLALDPLVGEQAAAGLRVITTTTQEESPHQGRITDWISEGKLAQVLGLPDLTPEEDRVMICGSVGLNKDMAALLEARGLDEGSNANPGHYVVEKAFVG